MIVDNDTAERGMLMQFFQDLKGIGPLQVQLWWCFLSLLPLFGMSVTVFNSFFVADL